jgi:hypothetical protein
MTAVQQAEWSTVGNNAQNRTSRIRSEACSKMIMTGMSLYGEFAHGRSPVFALRAKATATATATRKGSVRKMHFLTSVVLTSCCGWDRVFRLSHQSRTRCRADGHPIRAPCARCFYKVPGLERPGRSLGIEGHQNDQTATSLQLSRTNHARPPERHWILVILGACAAHSLVSNKLCFCHGSTSPQVQCPHRSFLLSGTHETTQTRGVDTDAKDRPASRPTGGGGSSSTNESRRNPNNRPAGGLLSPQHRQKKSGTLGLWDSGQWASGLIGEETPRQVQVVQCARPNDGDENNIGQGVSTFRRSSLGHSREEMELHEDLSKE